MQQDSDNDGESDANLTSSSNSTANETDDLSVAKVYPYWRATREKKESKNDKEEKKPFEPRPAKYKENYEDKGLKVFEPDYEKLGIVTTDGFKKLAGAKKTKSESSSKDKTKSEDEETEPSEGEGSTPGTAPA